MKTNRRTFLKAAAAGLASSLVPGLGQADQNPVLGSAHVREARFWERLDDGRVRCGTCPHGCVLADGERSHCRAKANFSGRLYTLSYGNPCTVHVDPVEKKPALHFLPGTRAFSLAVAGCNFRCLNCQNWEVSQTSPDRTRNLDLPPEAVVASAKKYGCASIAYTYSEPVSFYEYMRDTAERAAGEGLKNIWVSNAYINPRAVEELCNHIHAASLNLKSFSDDTYRVLNGGRLAPVLDTLKIVHSRGVWLEIIHLVVPTYTDDLGQIRAMARWIAENLDREVPFHLLRFTPRYQLLHLPPTPEDFLVQARTAAREEGLKHVYMGNVPGGTDVIVCPDCGRVVVSRRGYLLLENRLVHGACPDCGAAVAGRWE